MSEKRPVAVCFVVLSVLLLILRRAACESFRLRALKRAFHLLAPQRENANERERERERERKIDRQQSGARDECCLSALVKAVPLAIC